MTSSLRHRVLAEWRGLPETPPAPDRLHRLDGVLEKLMKKLGLTERLREEEITAAWAETVGENIAIHSCPSHLRQGVLHVRVLQPTLLYELDRVLKAEVLRKLRERFGAKVIRDVRFRIG